MEADETERKKRKNNAGSTIKHPTASVDVNHDACIHACIYIYNKTGWEGRGRERRRG